MTTTSIVWFRQDLRLGDNPALVAACKKGPVIPLYIHDVEGAGAWPPGAASRWWLHHSLSSLQTSLARHKAQLVLRRGDSLSVLQSVIKQTGATAVFWNDCYEPAALLRDHAVCKALEKAGIAVTTFNGSLLFAPGEITTNEGQPYKVYTPFWKKLRAQDVAPPLDVPKIKGADFIKGDRLDDWKLLPTKPDWSAGIKARWSPGELEARDKLDAFLENALPHYAKGRDLPAVEATSYLSPHLHFGEISPRQVWHRVRAHSSSQNAEKFLAELSWRDFSHQLLFYFPDLPEKPFRKEYDKFTWAPESKKFEAWKRGQTGFPIVDAGMRELWLTGYMHNRVRLITASFLTKDLLVPWQDGEKWFWDTLVDADLANNSFNWQWVAGSGADASPYFRIFNPELQGRKFDAKGDYIRRYVPELAALPDKFIHDPSSASADVLKKAGVVLGKTYPTPIVDHSAARDRAMAAYRKLR